MKTSTALFMAKQQLKWDCPQGVCEALARAKIPAKKRYEIEDIISQRLGGWGYATSWLADQVLFGGKFDHLSAQGTNYNAICEWVGRQSTADLQAWRHAWVDQMIAEFKAKGD